MKLKIDEQPDYKILTLSETISSKELEVVKAGVRRIFMMENKAVILDLTALAPSPPDVMQQLIAIKEIAKQYGIRFLLVSPETGVGDFTQRREAEKKIAIPPTHEEIEGLLAKRVEVLRKSRDELKAKLEQAQKSGGDLATLRREGSDAKWRISEVEKFLTEFAKELKPREESKELSARQSKIMEVLKSVLGADILGVAPK